MTAVFAFNQVNSLQIYLELCLRSSKKKKKKRNDFPKDVERRVVTSTLTIYM